ncbi:hypothetical protein P4S95_26750 [Aneurinibacillus aneurinilyticus]|uniref:hypothetical protein n=1 Tax=Aneurinibacillus aneurinilyticus TaxID=1391 RepID=UPI002E206377|nr:hypothetical protein [Aneurinibacillus aneurinilyticus]
MLNYGEELVYWYLRLNGFFLIDNFVLHQEQGGSRTSDSDLLGVRFPYVSETFGGQENDWDEKLFGKVDKNKILGFICEVKTGLDFRRGDLFRPDNVLKSIRRLGFTENIDLYSEKIINNDTVSIGEYEIYKVLFSRKKESEPLSIDWTQ